MPSFEPTLEPTSGLLTLLGTLKDAGATCLVRAKCACGYPAVIVSAEDWPNTWGCALCHPKEAAERVKQAAWAESQREAQERAERREASLRDLYLAPHLEDLCRSDRRLFEALTEHASFNVESVAQLMRSTQEEAWDAILRLVRANLLVEKRGWENEVRPYGVDEPYEMRCLRWSTYACRGVALHQLRDIQAKAEARASSTSAHAAAPPPAPPQLAVGDVGTFIAERCVVDEHASEFQPVLRAKYVAWCEERGNDFASNSEFEEALDSAGFQERKGKRVGVRMKKAGELNSPAVISCQ